MYVLLRLIAVCPDAATVSGVDGAALDGLAPWQAQATMAPLPAAGWPGQLEFTYRLWPGTRATFEAVVQSLAGGWHLSGDEADASAVWSAGRGPVLVSPAVQWAEVVFSAHGQLG